MLSKLGAFLGYRPTAKAEPNSMQARYENAQFTDENKRNWFLSDYFSAKAANNYEVRRILRIRSRQEVSNNPYMWGIAHDNANDLVNTGPTLKVTTPNKSYNKSYESGWQDWFAEVDGVKQVKTCKLAKTVDGEGILLLKTNPSQEHKVKLYPLDIEADQVTTPIPTNLSELWVDGLTLNPITQKPDYFHVLKHHPGDFFFADLNPLAVQQVSKRWVIHWFRKWRPGQVRGVPDFTASLDLWAECRAFRKATLTKAQVSANVSGILESEAPADTVSTEYKAWKKLDTQRGTLVTLPWGLKLHQYQTGDPSTTYKEFQHECLGEACRPLSYPLNRALGSSQDFNFSSAKLDHMGYHESLKVERADCDTTVLDHLLREYHREAVLVGLVPDGPVPAHKWYWPELPILDLAVETKADIDRINAGTLTWREFWAKRNHDWEEQAEQQKIEKEVHEKFLLDFGMPRQKQEKITDDADPNAKPGTKPPAKKKAGAAA